MMKQPIQPQNSEKIKQTASQLREIATRFDTQISILDELMTQVEAENRDYLVNSTRKMKILLGCLVFSLLTIFTDSSGLALPIPSFYQGMPYSEARTKMLNLGWQVPVINYSKQCEWMEKICSEYPEVDDCSGTGVGFCKFIFTDSNGKRFIITTAGRDPLKVVAWRNE